jgi:hypothetical protein
MEPSSTQASQPASQARVGRKESQGQGNCGGGAHDGRPGPCHCCYIVATPPSLSPHHARFVAGVVTSSTPLHSTPIDGLDAASERAPSGSGHVCSIWDLVLASWADACAVQSRCSTSTAFACPTACSPSIHAPGFAHARGTWGGGDSKSRRNLGGGRV